MEVGAAGSARQIKRTDKVSDRFGAEHIRFKVTDLFWDSEAMDMLLRRGISVIKE